jgi:cellulose synthase/poly-beta-1,6-N-acetylglucosamine synthase-like glycosyltransferase
VTTLLAHGGLGLLTLIVMAGAIPLLAAFWQFALIGVHGVHNHLGAVADFAPRTAILVPAWNEGAVVGATVERLLAMDYPRHALRVYVVDDASTDATPDVLQAKQREHPGRVFHVRRDRGGEGKAHTLNHGLKTILADDWCEALLIIDADVLFEDDALRKMARHLADPQVGAVTAYIKEGSHPANYLARFIGFEYITAQAAARRAQNVLGAMACLAGGAQLHSRTSLEAIGGRIDTTSLAEDTFTTFSTQREGRRAVFEGSATVWAEEPDTIVGLWKQRLRWARGNVQVTKRYRWLWFRRGRDRHLGGFSFGVFWFAIFLMPVFMIGASASLVTLFFVDFPLSWTLFHVLWITNAATYLFVTLFSFAIDPQTARRTWREGLLFPGVVALTIILATCMPPLFDRWVPDLLRALGLPAGHAAARAATLFVYVWLSTSMLVAWAGKLLETRGRWRLLSPLFVYLAGYGPLLCAITLASYVYEARGAEMKWDKTEKTGKVAMA